MLLMVVQAQGRWCTCLPSAFHRTVVATRQMTVTTKNLGSSSPLDLQLLSRFQLPGNQLLSPLPQPVSAHLLPGGNWLVAITALNEGGSGRPDLTGVSLWDLRRISTPRCVVDIYKEGSSCPSAVADLDKERGIARLVLGYSESLTPDCAESRK